MLRRALLWASRNEVLARRLPRLGFVQRATRRFLPGEELGDALAEAHRMAEQGMPTTLTRLGENVDTPTQADAVLDHYREATAAAQEAGLDTELSVKLTHLGLDQDLEDAARRIRALLEVTTDKQLLWLDMEDSTYTDRTMALTRDVGGDGGRLGICLQAYLRRTEGDVAALEGTGTPVRLVKGAYRESPSVALVEPQAVDRAFAVLTRRLLEARAEGHLGRIVVATHDTALLDEAARIAGDLELPPDAWEYAMLYGIRPDEQQRLAEAGHRVRVLIAYGSEWFPWYMRRLAERPANLVFVARQLLG